MVLSAIREQTALRLRARSFTWPRIAEECGYADEKAAREACKRALAKLRLGTEEDIDDLIAQAEQIVDSVVNGELPHDRANAALKGLGFIAKLKNVEPGQKVEHQHAHIHAQAVLADLEDFQATLGEVADREVQRRMAARAQSERDDEQSPEG